MSNRPAEHSDGDRSTRNAAHGPENMRFRAIRGALEPKPPLTRRFRTPERRQRLRRHATHVRRLRRRPARRQRPQPRRGARPRERHFGARRTFANRRKIDARPEMRRSINSYHREGHLAAKESQNSSMRRSSSRPPNSGTFATHACARAAPFFEQPSTSSAAGGP